MSDRPEPDMGACWELVLGGEPPAKVIETYKLNEKAFHKYVKSRIADLTTQDQMREKAMQLGQLQELLRSWWAYSKMDPKFGRLVLDVMKARRELIFPQIPGITPEKLGEVIDLERVQRVVRESKERKNAQVEAQSGPVDHGVQTTGEPVAGHPDDD